MYAFSATGMLALALSARPDLGWRDLQHIIIRSSVPVTTDDPSWSETAAGRLYSHKYAYGRLDAYLLVQEAVRWNKVRRQVTFRSAVCDVSRPIPTELTGLNSTITISQQDVSNALLSRLEHVTVTVNIEHTHRGDLDIYLISPNGIVSAIGPHRLYDANANIMDWTFMSVKHWEEPPVGNWTLRVVDQYNPQHKGRLINWQLKLWGEAVAGGGTPTQTTRTRVQPTATAQPPTPTTNNASSGNWRSLVLIGLVLSALMGGLIWLAVWCRVYALPWKEWRRRWLSSAAAVGRNGTESKYSSLEMDMNELEKAFGEDEDETNSGKEVSGGNESPSALLRKTPQQNIYTIESE
jgi:subtilisin-like proprotein convertase family protein